MRVIFESGAYRIVEQFDEHFNLEDLMGDTYCPKVNHYICTEQLAREKMEFIDLVNRENVYGYCLEKWNCAVGKGWTHIDSCFGFVGQYSPNEEIFNHHIVDELKRQIV